MTCSSGLHSLINLYSLSPAGSTDGGGDEELKDEGGDEELKDGRVKDGKDKNKGEKEKEGDGHGLPGLMVLPVLFLAACLYCVDKKKKKV